MNDALVIGISIVSSLLTIVGLAWGIAKFFEQRFNKLASSIDKLHDSVDRLRAATEASSETAKDVAKQATDEAQQAHGQDEQVHRAGPGAARKAH